MECLFLICFDDNFLYVKVQESWNLDWSYVKWQTPADITATLGGHNDHCVGLAGLFPGLRWRGAFLAVSAFLQPANHILAVTNALQERAVGKNTPFLAGIHHLCIYVDLKLVLINYPQMHLNSIDLCQPRMPYP